MMTSPLSKSGISCSMTISTGFPALIISITFLGFFNIDISVFTSSVPPIGNPFARPFKKVLTVLIFLEFTATEKPLEAIFKARFSPMTAMPINPTSYNIKYYLFLYKIDTLSLYMYLTFESRQRILQIC